jgi:glutathione S-transferase
MKLYYFSGACSLASNIALREAGLNFELVKVDRRTRKTGDGLDYDEVNPKGYVPALRLESGEVLTENIAVLQYIADQSPEAKLAPPAGTMDRYRLIEWLAFISTEIHKSFSPLFRDDAHAEVKQHARKHITARLGYLNGAMGSRSFLMGEQFTVADAYLFTVLGWGRYVDVQLSQWPQLQRHHERVGARPHVIAALKSEGLLK